MAAINFVKGEQYYTAEFKINGPVNIHIERAKAGGIYIRQKSVADGKYALINSSNWITAANLTIDTAIQGVVYPMWIKIESASEPTLAEMVEGEQSGGGAGTAESAMEYLDVSGMSGAALDLKQFLVLLSYNAKVGVSIVPPLVLVAEGIDLADVVSNATQCAINFDMQMYYSSTFMTIKELLIMRGVTEETLAAIPRITKEQFYSLEA